MQTEVPRWIELMFTGHPINNTEDRPALHVALRRAADRPLTADGENVMPLVEAERRKMRWLAELLHAGKLLGHTGKPITDVVNIGIGGSDLGIVMAVHALAEDVKPGLGVHYVSNVDGVALAHVLKRVNAATTLFVICSKSFTTLETLVNAQAVRDWLLAAGGAKAVAAQCVAVSTNEAAMDEFGIAPDRRLAMWDWVGGRYSVWSAVGLTVALAIGWPKFAELLAGGAAMDEHFRSAPLARNLPVLLALRRRVEPQLPRCADARRAAVRRPPRALPGVPPAARDGEQRQVRAPRRRAGRVRHLPGDLGRAGLERAALLLSAAAPGHGERWSVDFLLPARSAVGRQAQQDLAAANCLAQAWALAEGDPSDQPGSGRSPHQRYPGSRPSSLLLFERLDAATLGKLVALYEHKVYVQGVIWDVNSFDQWGVQLGKRLASELTGAVSGAGGGTDPPAIAGALAALRSRRGQLIPGFVRDFSKTHECRELRARFCKQRRRDRPLRRTESVAPACRCCERGSSALPPRRQSFRAEPRSSETAGRAT